MNVERKSRGNVVAVFGEAGRGNPAIQRVDDLLEPIAKRLSKPSASIAGP
jgi:hypothetical protein